MEKNHKKIRKDISDIYKEFGVKEYAYCIRQSDDLVEIYNFLVSDKCMLESLVEKLNEKIAELNGLYPDISYGEIENK